MQQHITINVARDLIVCDSVPSQDIEQITLPFIGENILSAGPIKVLSDGTHLPANSDRTDHIAVLHADGWMVYTSTLSDGGDAFDSQAEAINACKALRVLGFSDWDLAPRHVWERHVLDLERHNPAVDPNLYPGVINGWHHTSTDCAWSKDKAGVAASAWGVGSSYGGFVYGLRRSYFGFGLAARRVGQ